VALRGLPGKKQSLLNNRDPPDTVVHTRGFGPANQMRVFIIQHYTILVCRVHKGPSLRVIPGYPFSLYAYHWARATLNGKPNCPYILEYGEQKTEDRER